MELLALLIWVLQFYCFCVFLSFHFVEHFIPCCNMATVFASNFWNLRADGLDTRAITYKKWCIHNQMNRLLMILSSATYINWSVTCTIIFPIISPHENYTEVKVVHKKYNIAFIQPNHFLMDFLLLHSQFLLSQSVWRTCLCHMRFRHRPAQVYWWITYNPWEARYLSSDSLKIEGNLKLGF